jgi:hypothetical protein
VQLERWFDPSTLLGDYAELIRALPSEPISAQRLHEQFTLLDDGELRICFAPLGASVPTAKVVIVGITPGFQQAQIAMSAAKRCISNGRTYAESLSEAEMQCAFAGSMRSNMCRMLDELGVATGLRIRSTAALFEEEHRSLCKSTSAIRYPVFVRGENFTGHSPDMLKTPVLRTILENVLVAELREHDRALIVPCGDSVTRVIRHLQSNGLSADLFVLQGFPHASGANGHRRRQFAERRAALRAVVDRWAATVTS